MSLSKHLGLRLVLWVASVLLNDDLTDEERRQLDVLRTTLAVWRYEEARWD